MLASVAALTIVMAIVPHVPAAVDDAPGDAIAGAQNGAADPMPTTKAVWNAELDEISQGQIPIKVRIHPPISPDDVRLYARRLSLSDAQLAFAWSVFESYRNAYSKTIREHLPELIRTAAAVGHVVKNHLVFTEAYLDAKRELAAVVQSVDATLDLYASTVLFSSVKNVLAEAQLDQFARVERDRCRQRAMLSDWRHCTAAFDLAAAVERLALSDAELAIVDPLLNEYEQRFTPLVVQIERELDTNKVSLAEAMARVHLDETGQKLDLSTPEGQARSIANWHNRDRLLEKQARLQDSVLHINKEFLPKIIQLLPARHQRDFLVAYRERVYWAAYPDPGDPWDIHEILIGSKVIDPSTIEAIEAEWQTHQAIWTSLSRKMEAQMDFYWFEMAATEREPHGDLSLAAMQEWTIERLNADDRFLKVAMAMLPPERLAPLQIHFKKALVRIDSTRRDAPTRDYR